MGTTCKVALVGTCELNLTVTNGDLEEVTVIKSGDVFGGESTLPITISRQLLPFALSTRSPSEPDTPDECGISYSCSRLGTDASNPSFNRVSADKFYNPDCACTEVRSTPGTAYAP